MVRRLQARDLLMDERRARVEAVVENRTRSLVVVLEDLEDPHNISAVLRTCEGMGVQEVHAITRQYAFRPNRKISQGAQKWLDLHVHQETESCLAQLKNRGYLLCATDLGDHAQSLFDLPVDRPLALVFGTEKVGVSSRARALCDLCFKIPMLGFQQSLNISVAAAMCISHFVFKRLSATGSAGDLPPAERAQLRQRFYALAIKRRHRAFLDEDG